MSPQKPWEPKIEPEPEFNPFTNVGDQGLSSETPKLRNPNDDTSPLQGSRDLSDADSLEDVIADASTEEAGAGPTAESEKPPAGSGEQK